MPKRFKAKHLEDGRIMLNLACGGRMHCGWNNLDFSPLTRLAKRSVLARILRKIGVLSEKRFLRLLETDPDIICWDLRKGIPFDDDTFDVLYHSHFLEHLDKNVAPKFLRECHRVLKPSGVIRVVVPDLEIRCRNYINSVQSLSRSLPPNPTSVDAHEETVRRLLGQMVATELAGTAEQRGLVRMIERLVRGDSSKGGEIHRWMYDEHSLARLLSVASFEDVRAESLSTSRIEGWASFLLDSNEDGSAYKRDSIYLEALK